MKKSYLISVLLIAFSLPAYAQEEGQSTEAEPSQQPVAASAANDSGMSEETRAELEALRKELDELRHVVEEEKAEHEEEDVDAHEDGDDHDGEDDGDHDDEKKKLWVPIFSLMGDFYVQYAYHDDEVYSGDNRTGFYFRNLEIAIQSEIADEVYALIALHMTNEELHLESGYVYWSNVTPWLGLTFGVFREKFGRNNEIHSPEMNQFDRPIVIREYLGDEGLVATGFAMTFRLPKYKSYSAVIDLQIANSTNTSLFSGEFFNPAPTGVIHLENIWEKERTEVRFGLSGMFGANNSWGVTSESGSYVVVDEDPVDENGEPIPDEDGKPVWYIEEAEVEMEEQEPFNDEDWRYTAMAAMDLTAGWRYGKEKEQNVMWQSEFMYIYKEAFNEHLREKDVIHALGGYSYLQWRFIKNLAVGVRGDVVQPLDFDNEGRFTWAVTPYITWYQNSHLRIRAQYSYNDWAEGPEDHGDEDGHGHGGSRVVGVEHLAILQVTFAIGEGDLGAETPQRVRGGHFHAH
jgi:hypothetical protein